MFTKTSLRTILICCSVLIVAFTSWLGPLVFTSINSAFAAPPLPYQAHANGPYKVQANTIVDKNNSPYLIRGISRNGFEYLCRGDGPLDRKHLAYMGRGNDTQRETYWGANTVRLPLSQGFWLHGSQRESCSAKEYKYLIANTVKTLTQLNFNVILDLHRTNANHQVSEDGGQMSLPDQESITFWREVATTYKNNANIMFELFNEPYPKSWNCWRNGCPDTTNVVFSEDCQCNKQLRYTGVGMQKLVDTVRQTGANNLVIVAGMNWGYDLSKLDLYMLNASNIVYSTHPYPYDGKRPADWDKSFGNLSTKYAMVSTESGQYDCGTDFMQPLTNYFDQKRMGWVAWTWIGSGDICGTPRLIENYQGKPGVGMGTLLYQKLRSYYTSALT